MSSYNFGSRYYGSGGQGGSSGSRQPWNARGSQEDDQRPDIGDELAQGESPRQQQIAGEIYDQLKAGASVDDVKHLIGRLSQAATDTAAERKRRGDRA